MESEGKMNDGGAGKRDGGGGDFERYAGGEDTRMDMGLIGNIFGQHGNPRSVPVICCHPLK